MVKFSPADLYRLLDILNYEKDSELIRFWSDPARPHHDPDRRQRQIINLVNCLKALREYLKPFALSDSIFRCTESQNYLERYIEPEPNAHWLIKAMHDAAPPFSPEIVSSQIEGLLRCLANELDQTKFTYIPQGKAEFFDKDELFENDVHKKFPSAQEDIKAAGNCLAADLNTAAVYHLMRVLECGLRALARELKAKTIIKNLKQTQIPIELGTWEEIIKTANAKLDELRGNTRSHRRDSAIEFYSELLQQYGYVKDLWRNKVMHARATYDEHQAQSAFDHVKIFMQRLALRVAEKQTVK